VLGNNNSGNHYSGFKKIGDATKNDWVKVQGGNAHCIAMDSGGNATSTTNTSGYVWVWGNASNYRIGYKTSQKAPLKMANVDGQSSTNTNTKFTFQKVTDIATKGATTFIINDGTLYVCGHNSCGLAGDNATAASKHLKEVSTTFTPMYITCGVHTTYIISTDGQLYSTGRNHKKQLGHNTKTTCYKNFTLVDVNGTSSANVQWKPASVLYDIRNLKSFDAAYGDCDAFFMGATGPNEKYLYGFGVNDYGQLGTGSTFSCIDYDEKLSKEKDAITKTVKEYYGFDSYKKSLTSCTWSAIIKKQSKVTKINSDDVHVDRQLTLTSSNESLRFTIDLIGTDGTSSYYTGTYNLKGFAFTTVIDGITHNYCKYMDTKKVSAVETFLLSEYYSSSGRP
jgi:alpha-tubulin suppressor-like RCC1 family protein